MTFTKIKKNKRENRVEHSGCLLNHFLKMYIKFVGIFCVPIWKQIFSAYAAERLYITL